MLSKAVLLFCISVAVFATLESATGTHSVQILSGLSCNCTCAIPPSGPQEIAPVFQRDGPFFFAMFNCNQGVSIGFLRASIENGEPITYSLLGTPYIHIDSNTGDLTIAERIPVSGYYNATVAAATPSGRVTTRSGKFQALCGPNW